MKTTFLSILLATILAFLSFEAVAANPIEQTCPQCDYNPLNNKCDITTSCIQTQPTGQYHCACRAGYKTNDPNSQWRTLFAGQEYRVFVTPGVVCDTLCDNYQLGPKSCEEVPVKAQCS